MDEKYFLSIVIPAYNAEKLIGRCLDSVFLKQKTDYPLEVIVVDDGSSDGTRDVLLKYKESTPPHPLRIFRRENGGASVARNFGLSQAEGKYVLFLDDDDYLIEGTLDGFLRFADNSKAEIVAYLRKSVRIDGSFSVGTVAKPARGRGAEALHAMLDRGFFGANRDKIVSRRYLLDHDLFFMPGVIYEDIPWTAKLYAYDPLFAYYDKCIYTYEKRPGSVTKQKANKKNLASFRAIYEDLNEFISGISDADYVTDVKRIMSGVFFPMVSCLRQVQGQLTPEERADYLAFLEKEKSIIKFSLKANRRYIYRFIAEVFGVGALMKIKK